MAMEQPRKDFSHGPEVLTVLNRDLANEMNSVLMYLVDSTVANGATADEVKTLADKFARQDFKHAQRLASRIVDLEGTPDLRPQAIIDNASVEMKMPRHGEIKKLLTDALEGEMLSIMEYKSQIRNIAFDDPATRLLLEEILADKEHQAEELRHLLGMAGRD